VGYAFYCNEVNSDITRASRLTGIYPSTRLRRRKGARPYMRKKPEK
jgi:hypothetical protein